MLALWLYDHAGVMVRGSCAAVFGVAGAACLIAGLWRRWRARALLAFAGLLGAVILAFAALRPSNDRDWPPETARLPWAEVDGNRVTIHDVRNFDYRTEDDFTPAWYDRTVDLDQLTGVDLVASYWMGPAIAHLFVSFEFGGTEHVAISIEARRARGEPYSSLLGFFRRFELVYVVADERDVIRLRTNVRRDPPEEVYVYRLRAAPGAGRQLFLAYMDKINALRAHPEFYNSLTTNCANSIWMLSRVVQGHVPWSWKILASGYAPQYLYEEGRLDAGVPFPQLERRSHVNDRARAADGAADFSALIRAR